MRADAWTQKEEQLIRQLAGKLKAEKIAEKLHNRSYKALIMHASKLGISLKMPVLLPDKTPKPKPTTMTKEQSAIIIREAIREVAFTSRLKPSEIHLPSPRDANAVAARNRAIRLAHRQGVDMATLCSAFQRTRQLINSVITPIPCKA
jgi:hypothetical protein